MIKLVIPQPYSSNRVEYDYVFPLFQGAKDRVFLDTKVFAEQRPFSGSTPGSPVVQSYGQSARLGMRQLVLRGQGYWGASVGYDSLWQQGSYFQQAGIALEYSQPSVQWVLTAGQPFAAPKSQVSGNVPLSSVNLQVSLPTGIKALAVQPRIYAVGSDSTGSALGGQLQFTYAFAPGWSATLASNYDAIEGVSGSLTLQVVFPQRSAEAVGGTINSELIGGYGGPVGNNGSRVIRLDGSPVASGN